jgi:protocatechuate 3,4-dioxygenase beta subunit
LLLASAAATQQDPVRGDEPFVQFTPPPGALTPEETALLERAKDSLESKGADVSAVLTDAAYMPIHARTEFRELIAAHATAEPLTLCGPSEPGIRLTVTLEFLDGAGEPVRDALVYVYHTSAKGWYSDKAAHVQANAGDMRHARLFGYARTDVDGRVEVRTIRPSGYPKSDLPAHIHLGLTVDGKSVMVGEVQFDDDPRLTPQQRKHSAQEGAVIVEVTKEADGSQRCHAVFKIQRPAKG